MASGSVLPGRDVGRVLRVTLDQETDSKGYLTSHQAPVHLPGHRLQYIYLHTKSTSYYNGQKDLRSRERQVNAVVNRVDMGSFRLTTSIRKQSNNYNNIFNCFY